MHHGIIQKTVRSRKLMDYLKTQEPFWKKERTPEGEHWVDARVSDDADLAKWGIVAGNA